MKLNAEALSATEKRDIPLVRADILEGEQSSRSWRAYEQLKADIFDFF